MFDIHDCIGLKFLFQVRVGLSPLKYHKKRHNFADTSDDTCDCGLASEDIAHYLFFCPLFDIPRLALKTSVSNILNQNNLIELSHDVDTYIFGHHLLSLMDNKSIILSTIAFIKDKKRFS